MGFGTAQKAMGYGVMEFYGFLLRTDLGGRPCPWLMGIYGLWGVWVMGEPTVSHSCVAFVILPACKSLRWSRTTQDARG